MNRIKHYLRATLLLVLLAVSWQTKAQTYSGGDGSSTSPYLISTVGDLQGLSSAVSGGNTYEGKYFKLTADLDLSSVCSEAKGSWTPIGEGIVILPMGNNHKPFKGHFDGGGHTISNLYISNVSSYPTRYYLGLFGYIIDAEIKNLRIADVNVIGLENIGGLCGVANNSSISNCINYSGSVTSTNGVRVGGICGSIAQSSSISSCINASSISGKLSAAGICGTVGMQCSISNSLNFGSISGAQDIGGIGGNAEDEASFSNCINSGNVIGTKYPGNNSITEEIGGICGGMNSTINNCINTGSVTTNETTVKIGGICGYAYKGSAINNCYYDKQVCTIEGVGATDQVEMHLSAEGKLTSFLTSGGLFNDIANWSEAAGRYPIPAGVENSDISLVAAAPIILNGSDLKYETLTTVSLNFKVGTVGGVTWAVKSGDVVSIAGANATVADDKTGSCELMATLNGVSKTVAISAPSTGEKPLIIGNHGDLMTFQGGINSGDAFIYKNTYVPANGKDMYFMLAADIDLGGKDAGNWSPIGNSTNPFQGNFDGGGHIISNLYINASDADNQGLFGCITNAEVKNIQMVDVNVTGQNNVSSVCGNANNSTISNCISSGSVNGTNYTGGICGHLINSAISKCLNTCSINGTRFVGGISGGTSLSSDNSTISNCFNSGSVVGIDAGGICGYSYNSDVSNNPSISYCISSGSVSSGSVSGDNNTTRIGSVCGWVLAEGAVSNCYYDKQIFALGGISKTDVEGKAEGKPTSELASGSLFNNAEHWSEAAGRYPIPAGLENSKMVLLVASPVILFADGADNTKYDTPSTITSNFKVGTVGGVTWSSSNAQRAAISGSDVTVAGKGEVTLTATIGNLQKKLTLTSIAGAEVGSKSNPHTIDNIDELVAFRNGINTNTEFTYKGNSIPAKGENAYFRLTADIDLSSICGADVNGSEVSWIPIGVDVFGEFKGHFDGYGHTISNLYINKDSESRTNLGLFGFLYNASISNLALANVDITGDQNLGGIAGSSNSNSRIQSCVVTGNITSTNADSYIGGILGSALNNNVEISHCLVSGTLTGSTYVGGICGVDANINNCIFNSIVKGISCVGAISNGWTATITQNYYDKQINPVFKGKGGMANPDGIGSNYGYDIEGEAEGKLTSELTSGSLFNDAEQWSEAAGRYPIPASLKDNEAAHFAATPITFAATDADNYETVNAAKNNFSVGIQNGVTWSSSNPAAIINAGDGSVDISRMTITDKLATLTVTDKNGKYSRAVDITVNATLGGETEPITIDSAADLAAFRDAINDPENKKYKELTLANCGKDLYFKLTADIDLSSVCNATAGSWAPIGTHVNALETAFQGHFDGDSHTISNLYINSTSDHQGLFGYVRQATIKNVQLVGTNVKGGNYVGGICGEINSTTISNCANSGSISGTGKYIGGLCGYALSSLSKIENCINSGSVSGTEIVGGICGWLVRTTITHCLNSGSVSGANDIGGICGEIQANYGNTKMEHCLNSGSVSGTGNNVGGICGNATNTSSIENCVSNGSVSGTGNVGGVCGCNNNITITSCYYDKQMCTAASGIGDPAGNTGAEGKLTSEMVGESLKASLGETNWAFATGMYPIPAGLETSDAAIVAAAPIFLANEEKADAIASNFTVGASDGTAWSIDNTNFAEINGSNITLKAIGDVVLTVTKGLEKKSVNLKLTPTIIATINATEYLSLQSAIDAAVAGDEVRFVASTTEGITLDKSIALAVENGAVLTGNFTVMPSGRLKLSTDLAVDGDFTVQTSLNDEAQVIGSGVNVTATNIYMQHKVDGMLQEESFFGITLPFPANLSGGILNSVDKSALASPTQVRVYQWEGNRRAANGSAYTSECNENAWQRLGKGSLASANIEAGKPYMVGLTSGCGVTNITFKSASTTWTVDNTSKASGLTEFASDNYVDAGWNFVAQPFSQTATTDLSGFVQILRDGVYALETVNGNTRIAPYAAFFVQKESSKDNIAFSATAESSQLRSSTVSRSYEMRLTQAATGQYDRIFFTASDDASSSYAIGRDLAKLGVSAKAPQIYIKEKESTLCVCDAPIADGEARMALRLSIPASGSYALSLPSVYDDATVYLSKDGADIWNFANGAYSLSANKGIDSTYALHLVYRSAEAAIEVGNIDAPAAICSGSALSLNEPSIEDNGTQYSARWEISGDSFVTATEYMGQTLTEANDGWKLRYAVTTEAGKTYFSNEAAIEVNLDPSYLVRLWDDMLVCSNTKEIRFDSWQWYKDGTSVDGQFATRPYIQLAGSAAGYQVAATAADGHTYRSCPVKEDGSVHKSSLSVSLKAYPNPSPASEPLKIEVVGMEDGMLDGAVLTVFSTTGMQVLRITDVRHINEIRLPQGVFAVTLTQNGRTFSTKVIRR